MKRIGEVLGAAWMSFLMALLVMFVPFFAVTLFFDIDVAGTVWSLGVAFGTGVGVGVGLAGSETGKP